MTAAKGTPMFGHKRITRLQQYALIFLALGSLAGLFVAPFVAAEVWLVVALAVVFLSEAALAKPVRGGKAESGTGSALQIAPAEENVRERTSLPVVVKSVRDVRFLLNALRGTHFGGK